MKKKVIATILFFIIVLNLFLLSPLQSHASATNMDEAIANVKNTTDYIQKWKDEYVSYRQITSAGYNYDVEEFSSALATFVNDFKNTANSIEQKYFSDYLNDEAGQDLYEGRWEKSFFESCRDSAFVISILDEYTEYFSSYETFAEGNLPLYKHDEYGTEVYIYTPFYYVECGASELFYRLYYSAVYHNATESDMKSDASSKLEYIHNLAPSNIYSYDIVGTFDGTNPDLLTMEKNIFLKWNIKNNTASSLNNTLLNLLPIDNITESIIQSLSTILATFSLDVLTSVSEQFLDLGPSLDLFMNYFGKNTGNTLPDGKTLIDLNTIFLILGYVIASGLFLFFLIMCGISPASDKYNVLQLCIAYPLVLIGIYYSDSIINVIYDLALSAWNTLFADSFFESTSLPYLMAYLVTVDYLNITWTLQYLGTLFNVAVGWIIIKNALSMFIEIVERYVVSCLLYFGFGTSLSTLVSGTTRPIFFAYMRMIISQLFLLFMNIYFIKGFFLLLVNYESWSYSIYGIIFVLAYLKTAQRIDGYLQSLGLNIAQTGSNLTSAVMGIGATMVSGAFASVKMAQTAGKLGAKVGKAGTMAAGHAMESAALSKGNFAMYNKAQSMKQGKVFGGKSPSEQSLQNFAVDSAIKKPTGKAAFNGAMSDSKVGSAVNTVLGGNAAASLKSNLSSSAKANLGKITSAQFGASGGGATFSAQNTSIGGKSHAISGSISKSADGGGRYIGPSTDGSAMFAKVTSKPSAQIGDSFSVGVRKDQNGFAMSSAEMMTGVDFSKAPGLQERLSHCEGATLHCQAGKNGNMYTLTDADNNLIGGFDSYNNYYSADRSININEKDFAADGKFGSLGFENVWCYSSELDSQLNGNSTLSPEELNERMSTSLTDLHSKIESTKDELTDTLKEIDNINADIRTNSSDPDYDIESVESHLSDLKAKENSLRESIETDTNYYESISSFKDSLDELAEYGYKDTFCGIRNGNVELYRMENVTVSDAAMGDTKDTFGTSIRFTPLGDIEGSKLGI